MEGGRRVCKPSNQPKVNFVPRTHWAIWLRPAPPILDWSLPRCCLPLVFTGGTLVLSLTVQFCSSPSINIWSISATFGREWRRATTTHVQRNIDRFLIERRSEFTRYFQIIMLGIPLLAIMEFFSRLGLILMLKAYNQIYWSSNFFLWFFACSVL